jgi:allantoinase
MEFSVRVETTYCRGQAVFANGQIVNSPGAGQFLRPHTAQGEGQ